MASAGTFSAKPPLRSSNTTTLCPIVSKCSATWEPMKPAPPVTREADIRLNSSARFQKLNYTLIFPCYLRELALRAQTVHSIMGHSLFTKLYERAERGAERAA